MAVFIICNTSPFTHSTPPHELQTSLPHHAVRFQENVPRLGEKVRHFQEKVPRFRENLRRLRERVRPPQKTYHISECSSSWIPQQLALFFALQGEISLLNHLSFTTPTKSTHFFKSSRCYFGK